MFFCEIGIPIDGRYTGFHRFDSWERDWTWDSLPAIYKETQPSEEMET